MEQNIREYLTALITEKGQSLENGPNIDGHIGLTWEHLIDFIETIPAHHEEIRKTLVGIDFQNGDIFHYLTFLSDAMIKAKGLDTFS
ncbi:hypothetical protein QX249_10690 [Vibrio parahaemolyticus]|uniref:Uncharacterized protein n=1 Tax=Vibrio parahaemolyticus TaxID=670 RepID=A0AAW8Q3W1_VIBPH|nr:hypothetical protein [Vibrio parahaemolyticus]MDS1821128.1 hypothetical protein [Vibrio parahaemolyticus]